MNTDAANTRDLRWLVLQALYSDDPYWTGDQIKRLRRIEKRLETT